MTSSQNNRPTCLLSFDVEEMFQIEAARPYISPRLWDESEWRVGQAVEWILEELAKHDAHATFFLLGWVAERNRAVVRRIVEAGHEAACHGHAHERLHELSPESFRADLRRAKEIIEDITGQPVVGYRAPTFSLTRQTQWAVDVLIEEGFKYDSSVQPVRGHPQYGEPTAPVAPFQFTHSSGAPSLTELPPLTWKIGSLRLPVAGGGYFRALPLSFMRAGIRQAGRQDRPPVLYFHPWEFDVNQPRLPLPALAYWRTYIGLNRTRNRLTRLLKKINGIPLNHWLTQHDPIPASTFTFPANRAA
ncbi:MAG: hypothetical protein CMJ49_10240 [Planctomycetaceae bacterium]|nr:hypothetical protein [Planctomycetaceae bacterium]